MSFPTRMLVGPGAVQRLPDEMARLEAKRALIVTDPGLFAVGIPDQVEAILKRAQLGAAIYQGVSKNPKEQDVLSGVDTYSRVNAEVVIGLGGGAAMDVAKTIALKTTHDRPLVQYDDTKGGCDLIHSQQPPMIAIPTTAGTGSEVGRASVICIGESNRKVVIFSPFMMPKVAICDAELTVGLPPSITAATGIDALTHNLEAYVALGAHPFSDMFALAGLARIGAHLIRATRDGSDLEARHEMMIAASCGAIAFQKGLGACHALAHPLSSVADVHHGLANALMLPHVIRYNLTDPKTARRYETASTALGGEPSAEGCYEVVSSIARGCGLPSQLSAVGVEEDMIAQMVPQAIQDACAPGNPVPLTEAAARSMYEAAF